MPQCNSKRCKAKLEAGWIFCPYCGTDNRPPTFRPTILACPHSFHESEGFCFRCGDCRDGRPTAAQREAQATIGRNLFAFGLFAIIVAFAISYIHDNRYPGNQYLQPWYDEAYQADGKQALRGDEYMSWAEIGGGALCGVGILAMIVARINAGKRRTR
jgi:hypothetical protein